MKPEPAPRAVAVARSIGRLVAAFVLLAALSSAGCVSAKYQSAAKDTPPPVMLHLTATQPPIEAVLDTVIVFRGPGSWKRDAYWDEYVVTLANRGEQTVTIEAASLLGMAGTTLATGTEPWSLEKQSRTLADRNFGLAKDAAVQVGSGVVAIGAGAGVGFLWATAMHAGYLGAASLGVGAVVAVPFIVAGSMQANTNGRRAIESEFRRRQLGLPATLAGGQVVQGSLFFPITPGPRRLTLRCKIGEESRELVVDLAPLAALHLSPGAKVAK